MVWLLFFISAGVIIIAGMNLSKAADIIGEKTGFGQAWAGALLLPLATSLPEISTSLSAVLIGAHDIAIGNVFGSNMFNIAIIGIVDVVHGHGSILRKVQYGHILTASLGVLVTALAALGILVKFNRGVFGVGYDTLLITLIYFYGAILIMRYQRRHFREERAPQAQQYRNEKVGKAVVVFIIAAAAIVFAGTRLAVYGQEIANVTGLGGTFVGSVFIAVTTSLPELVSAITSSVRLKAYDLAVGNVFGANTFNMLILIMSDFVARGRYLLSVASTSHVITAMMAIVLTSIALIGLIYRSDRTILSVGIDGIAIIITYLLGVYLLFSMGIGI